MRLALAGLLLVAVVAAFLARQAWPPSAAKAWTEAASSFAPELPDASRTPPATPTVGNEPAANESARLVAAIVRGLATESDCDRALHEWLARLSDLDPASARRLVRDWPAGPARTGLLRHFARYRSDHDIGNALDWLATLAPADRTLAAEAMLAQVAQTDPAGALSLAEVFAVGLDDGRVERIVQLWTEESPAEAFEWLRSRRASPVRELLVARAAWARAQADPAAATALVFELMPGDGPRDDALAGVLRHWAAREPEIAARLISSPEFARRDAPALAPTGG